MRLWPFKASKPWRPTLTPKYEHFRKHRKSFNQRTVRQWRIDWIVARGHSRKPDADRPLAQLSASSFIQVINPVKRQAREAERRFAAYSKSMSKTCLYLSAFLYVVMAYFSLFTLHLAVYIIECMKEDSFTIEIFLLSFSNIISFSDNIPSYGISDEHFNNSLTTYIFKSFITYIHLSLFSYSSVYILRLKIRP
jgi:hypothetical protein